MISKERDGHSKSQNVLELVTEEEKNSASRAYGCKAAGRKGLRGERTERGERGEERGKGPWWGVGVCLQLGAAGQRRATVSVVVGPTEEARLARTRSRDTAVEHAQREFDTVLDLTS
ncbi:unnamed protein product [Danaus chrysippus]|uniref:(African queen) hypothetical protein n=1 Tax=Danaus chrysippus TaxID=151541 RepID=A0A8J2QME7_9NEOP|nr:unnamed protein product [Danaus chrysippus]